MKQDGRARAWAGWIAATAAGAALLLWVAVANGFPLLFSDSGGYLRVGTELHYLPDRPIVYGLMIAPFARAGGLWAIVIAQALFCAVLIGETLAAVTRRRSPLRLLATLTVLAALSSLPWFAGQIMPDVLTGLVALLVFLILFGPGEASPWRRWWPPLLLVPLIAAHLSHLPIAAALTGIGLLVALWRRVPGAWSRAARATSALIAAVFVLCAINLAGAHRFTPSGESRMFLVARLFDGRVGQPVLDAMCRETPMRLCAVAARMDDPRRAAPGQDYLWAPDIRAPLAARDPAGVRSEEGALVARVIRERPLAVLRLALDGWGRQLVDSRSADGMTPYPPTMQVSRQVRIHFASGEAAFQASREQQGTLPALAVVPDQLVALIVALLSPLILLVAVRRGDDRLIGLTAIVLGCVVVNAGVCGILSGPANRYESRVLWLLPLLAAIALATRDRRFPAATGI